MQFQEYIIIKDLISSYVPRRIKATKDEEFNNLLLSQESTHVRGLIRLINVKIYQVNLTRTFARLWFIHLKTHARFSRK